jgi:hypothetical protein
MQQAVLSGVRALLGAGGWREAAVWPHSRWSALLPVSESVTAGLRERHLLSTACIWQLLLQDAVQVMCAVGVACDAAVTKDTQFSEQCGCCLELVDGVKLLWGHSRWSALLPVSKRI